MQQGLVLVCHHTVKGAYAAKILLLLGFFSDRWVLLGIGFRIPRIIQGLVNVPSGDCFFSSPKHPYLLEMKYHLFSWVIFSWDIYRVQNPCWLMISWGILLPKILGIMIIRERGIPIDYNSIGVPMTHPI